MSVLQLARELIQLVRTRCDRRRSRGCVSLVAVVSPLVRVNDLQVIQVNREE